MNFFDKLDHIGTIVRDRLPDALLTLIIGFIVIEAVISIFGKLLRVTRFPVELKKLVYALTRVFLWVVLFLAVIQTLGLNNLLVAVTGSGVIVALFLSTGVGPIVTDVLAGLSLGADRDFQEKATIRVGDKQTEGIVERLELRKTRLRGKDGKLHVIPNSVIDKNEWVVLKSHRK